jgi:hypothetical protein
LIDASPKLFQRVILNSFHPFRYVGRFAVILKEPGDTIGYAFLQPGKLGRIAGGYPVRQDF